MIRAPGAPDPPVPRLLSKIASRSPGGDDTLVVSAGTGEGPGLDALLAESHGRILVMSALGAHPDARAARLRSLWNIEERVRRSGRASLTLRLAPIVGADSPLWLRLRTRPHLGREADTLFNPVHEDDVVETMTRALDGRAKWEGWYAVAGPEVMTLSEACALAARTERLEPGAGAWEPPLAELREHRIPELEPWTEHFALLPCRVSQQAERWT